MERETGQATGDAPPAATQTKTEATTAAAPAALRWKSYAIVMALLLAGGALLARHPIEPSFIVPRWLRWLFRGGGRGDGLFAIAILLGAAMANDAVDLLLARSRRSLAYVLALAAIVALAALAVVTFLDHRPIIAIAAALMATIGPLARHVVPGLPRARARYR